MGFLLLLTKQSRKRRSTRHDAGLKVWFSFVASLVGFRCALMHVTTKASAEAHTVVQSGFYGLRRWSTQF